MLSHGVKGIRHGPEYHLITAKSLAWRTIVVRDARLLAVGGFNMLEITQTIRFEHDTMGQQENDTHRGGFTLEEWEREELAYKLAGWKEIARTEDDETLEITYQSGIVLLIIEGAKV